MKKAFLILTLLFTVYFAFGDNVSKELAERVAINYYFQTINSCQKATDIKFDEIELTCIQDPSIDETKSLYIFNVNNDEGFIIVSSNDNIKPILAYSFEAEFNIGNISPSQQYLLDYYELMNLEAAQSNLLISADIKKEWLDLAKFKSNQTFKTKTTVDGLLGLIEWNQSSPYNAMCPSAVDEYTGSGNRCPVGCSAIAMLQIMKYYNWPITGTGSYTHYSWDNGDHGNFTVNFGQNTYDWYSMPSSGHLQNDMLAKICFHAGVAVKMHWSADGSGASPSDVATAMVNYFKYEDNIDLLYKEDYSEEDWKVILRAQIDDLKPIFYVGYTEEAGHAWNCDGYQGEEHFHMNWGWGGYGNGFYTLDALGTSATPGNSDGNYNQWQHALINIYPEGGFPRYCNDLVTITGVEGSFGDGSSYENYQDNSSCTYVIEPECRQIVLLEFTNFDLNDGDFLTVWNGTPEENKLLGDFDAENIPEDVWYESTSGKMTVNFVSDENLNSNGWSVNYKTKSCISSRIYTESSGSFNDGSRDCQYSGATLCSWKIQPEESVDHIYIDFESFNIAEGIDFVYIYKDSINTNTLVAEFDFENEPSETITVESGTAIVRFFAGVNSTLGDGWEINYNSAYIGVEDYNITDEIFISPNPGNLNSNIIIKTEEMGNVNIAIYDILGKILGEQSFSIDAGINNVPLSAFTQMNSDGMYFITIKLENKSYSLPFILAE